MYILFTCVWGGSVDSYHTIPLTPKLKFISQNDICSSSNNITHMFYILKIQAFLSVSNFFSREIISHASFSEMNFEVDFFMKEHFHKKNIFFGFACILENKKLIFSFHGIFFRNCFHSWKKKSNSIFYEHYFYTL